MYHDWYVTTIPQIVDKAAKLLIRLEEVHGGAQNAVDLLYKHGKLGGGARFET